jgi:hypothetical protein
MSKEKSGVSDAEKVPEALSPDQRNTLQKLFIGYSREIRAFTENILSQTGLAKPEKKQVMEILERVMEESKVEHERMSLDMVMKELSMHFKEALAQMLEGYKINPKQIECLIGRELIAVKRIADVIFEVEDAQGNKYLLSVEFEASYKSDEKMDQRIAEYQHLSSMDREFKGRRIKCNVFYLQSSPQNKRSVEKRKSAYSPENNPDLKIEIVYQVFHLNKFDIPMILRQNLSFLIPLMSYMPKATSEEREKYKTRLTKMAKNWDEKQRHSAENLVDYISKNQHNDSRGITIKEMLEGSDLNIREDAKREGIQKGIREGIQEGKMKVLRELFSRGIITYKILEEILGEKGAKAIRLTRDKAVEALRKK